MFKAIATLACLSLTLSVSAAHADGNSTAGGQKIKTLQCLQCHGRDGVSKLPGAPNLAGQVPEYLVAALNDYRSGARKNDMMSVVAQKLTDADIADVAAYYSGIQITVTPPPKP